MTLRPLFAALGFGAVCVSAARAVPDFSLASGPERVSLVELYTSEGCSSCPPADAFLGALANNPGLWTRWVPLAFHVDYWDNLGWKDPYARPEYARRQREIAAAQNARGVYTPNFVVDGAEWRGFFQRDPLPAPAGRGGLLTARPAAHGDGIAVTYQPETPGRYVAHAAVLAMDLSSDVKRGENGGRTLRHDFVVQDLAEAPLAPSADDGTLAAVVSPAFPAQGRLALAVWVTRAGSQVPVQAAGGVVE